MINRNIILASIIVDELVKKGVEYAIIGAGSRSTPLTLAFSQHPNIVTISQVDERSGGFMALGIAQYSRKPVVLISTSGTATANFFPAVIEAKQSNVPLIVLTADRPPHLRDSGANQTINQLHLYGHHVNYFTDLVVPVELGEMNRYLRREVTQHYLRSTDPLDPGPTHINIPLDKPLEPAQSEDQIINPLEILDRLDLDDTGFNITLPKITYDISDISRFMRVINGSNRIIIIAGPKVEFEVEPKQLLKFSAQMNIPIFADGVSGLRCSKSDAKFVISGYESFLQLPTIGEELQPDLIIQIGQLPVSKYLLDHLEMWKTSKKIIMTRFNRIKTANYEYQDLFQVDLDLFLDSVLSHDLSATTDQSWLKRLISVENTTWSEIEKFTKEYPNFEGSMVKSLLENIKPNAAVFISSSLAIRHVDQFVRQLEHSPRLFANRGASGIDGTISSALGVAMAHSGPTYLISGDLSFYHDMNGLLAMQRYQIKMGVLILNNHGGAIFNRLPIFRFDPPLSEFFLTPHDIAFEHIAQAYNITYRLVTSSDQVEQDGIFEFRDEISKISDYTTKLIQVLKKHLLGK